MSLWIPGRLKSKELAAIRLAMPEDGDQFAKLTDIPSAQLTADELTAIQNASLTASDTVAKISDIPSAQLTADELTAIQNASLTASDTVAKISDIPSAQLTADELTAIQNASLSNTDTVAKISDLATTNIEIPLDRIKTSASLWNKAIDVNCFNNISAHVVLAENGTELYSSFSASSGIYELIITTIVYSHAALCSVYVDDVLQGTFDMYYSGATSYNYRHSVFCNITTNGAHKLKIVYGKNPSSSGYGLYCSSIWLKKVDLNWNFVYTHGFSTNYKAMYSAVVAGNAIARQADGSVVPFGEYWWQNTSAVNDETQSPGLTLPAGTYQIKLLAATHANGGIVSIYEGANLLDTWDTYSAGTVYNQTKTTTFTLSATTTTNIKLKVADKNASSSGYELALTYIEIIKTA